MRGVVLGVVVCVAGPARAALWEDVTAETLGATAEWTSKVELADVDGDGWVDVLFANGRGYSTPKGGEANRVFLNPKGAGAWGEAAGIMGGVSDQSRAIKVRDLTADGVVDIVVANTYQTQSRLLRGLGGGVYEDASSGLPQEPRSFGDVEAGDVDGDGDLDLVFADWGAGNALSNAGGRTRLWLNDGAGGFTDATEAQMPDVLVRFSWELELVDADGDLDLDVAVSCKSCKGSFLFLNDGAGGFTDAPGALPAFSNNYDFEPMDLDGDGRPDLVTINDGPGLKEHLLLGGDGVYTDATASWWPAKANVGEDDNVVRFLDVDSDGDADFVIGSLSGADRLLTNQGGTLSLHSAVFAGVPTPGTLDLGFADLDRDGRLDVVAAQGEVGDETDRLYLGVDVAKDTAAPTVALLLAEWDAAQGAVRVVARVHDRKSPVMPHDFEAVRAEVASGDAAAGEPLAWLGEQLWRAVVAPPGPGEPLARVCATDAAGNEACTAWAPVAGAPGGAGEDAGAADGAGDVAAEGEGGDAGVIDAVGADAAAGGDGGSGDSTGDASYGDSAGDGAADGSGDAGASTNGGDPAAVAPDAAPDTVGDGAGETDGSAGGVGDTAPTAEASGSDEGCRSAGPSGTPPAWLGVAALAFAWTRARRRPVLRPLR